MTAPAILERLVSRQDFTRGEAGELMRDLIDPDVSDIVKGAILAGFRAKGVTPDELSGMALALRAEAVPVDVASVSCRVDTCGTGGDGTGSINLSTATALLVAAMGIPVVKHGNRSVSSRSGSADVLEALDIHLPANAGQAVKSLRTTGFAFLFAPVFHPAMKAVAPVRKALGVRTVFNLLGPLVNPAAPTHQLVGAYSPEAARLIAQSLSAGPVQRAFVVHGALAWDEATPVGPFLLLDVHHGAVTERIVDPADYGYPRCDPLDLKGGDPDENARLLQQSLMGTPGPKRDAVALNAALVLQLVESLEPREAASQANDALEQGRAIELLDRLRTRVAV